MKDELVSGASDFITISGKELEVWPLSDKDLDSLTNWVRFKIKQRAREEAAFSDSPAERRGIIDDSIRYVQGIQWYSADGINVLLNDIDGLVRAVMFMTKDKWKKDFFESKFGTASEMSEEQIENRNQVQQVFLQQNTMSGPDAEDSDGGGSEGTGKKS